MKKGRPKSWKHGGEEETETPGTPDSLRGLHRFTGVDFMMQPEDVRVELDPRHDESSGGKEVKADFSKADFRDLMKRRKVPLRESRNDRLLYWHDSLYSGDTSPYFQEPSVFRTVPIAEVMADHDLKYLEKASQNSSYKLESRDNADYLDYTEVRIDQPEDWRSSGLQLRFGRGPRVELFIVITLYNEDEKELEDTMQGVIRNVAYYCKKKAKTMNASKKKGDREIKAADLWREVVVCIVADGRALCNEGITTWLNRFTGLYSEELIEMSLERLEGEEEEEDQRNTSSPNLYPENIDDFSAPKAHLFEAIARIPVNDSNSQDATQLRAQKRKERDDKQREMRESREKKRIHRRNLDEAANKLNSASTEICCSKSWSCCCACYTSCSTNVTKCIECVDVKEPLSGAAWLHDLMDLEARPTERQLTKPWGYCSCHPCRKKDYKMKEGSSPPLQMMFCLKEKNKGKLDSHRWYFQAFASQLNPKYCVLLDIGTIPRPDAIYKLWEAFEKDYRIGGCCGEIIPHTPALFNPVVSAQVFEYKLSHVLDKAFESALGYISVLPGAFSAYRWKAIRDDLLKRGPLQEYFKSITSKPNELTPFDHNMYLAEDRILCFEIVSRNTRVEKNFLDEAGLSGVYPSGWLLKYIKSAVAETDVPSELTGLIKQRRRWLNGSLFAMIGRDITLVESRVFPMTKLDRYSIKYFQSKTLRSDHSCARKLFLTMQFGYYILQSLLTFFSIAIMYLGTLVTINGAVQEGWFSEIVWDGFRLSYTFSVVCLFLVSLGNKPNEMKSLFYLISTYYAVLMTFATATAVFLVLNLEEETMRLSGQWMLFLSVGVYFFFAILHSDLLSVLITFPAYVFLVPTYVNTMSIFSFCNLHDVSWGTRSANVTVSESLPRLKKRTGEWTPRGRGQMFSLAQQEKARAEEEARKQAEVADDHMKAFRSSLLIGWVGCNGGLIGLVNMLEWYDGFLILLFAMVLFFNVVRCAGSAVFLLNTWRNGLRPLGKVRGDIECLDDTRELV